MRVIITLLGNGKLVYALPAGSYGTVCAVIDRLLEYVVQNTELQVIGSITELETQYEEERTRVK